MKAFLFGFVIAIAGVIFGAYLFLVTGQMPVATNAPPLPLEKWAAQVALRAALRGQESVISPVGANEESFLAGAKIYLQYCSVCHGQLNAPATYIAKGLFPKPPQLLETDDQVTDDPIGKIYWKVKNGIRLTGMPGFVGNLTEKEMWQVSEMLLHANQLPASVQKVLAGPERK